MRKGKARRKIICRSLRSCEKVVKEKTRNAVLIRLGMGSNAKERQIQGRSEDLEGEKQDHVTSGRICNS